MYSGHDIYAQERISGRTPLVTAVGINNGVGYFVSNENNSRAEESISVVRNGASVGKAFYHKYSALYGNDCRRMKLKHSHSEFVNACVKNKVLYLDVVTAYLDADTPYNIYPQSVISNLFKLLSPEEVKEVLESHDYTQKNAWLWGFYDELPPEQLSLTWEENFLHFLGKIPKDMKSSTYRPLNRMEKFETVDEALSPQQTGHLFCNTQT